jgi:REP element-mobilizing transposase RayT
MQPLEPNTVYHIYNHANGFENVFSTDENFRFFLDKYKKHITPIAETYAYCLMPNHFHLVVRIRKRDVIEKLILSLRTNFSKVQNFGKVVDVEQVDDKTIELFLSKQFANLFSSYTQAFNKLNNRRGSLFIKNFKRNIIDNKRYFLNTIIYTHRNPVHHGFCRHFNEWQHSSYNDTMLESNDLIEAAKILQMFENKDNFIAAHEKKLLDFNFSENDI